MTVDGPYRFMLGPLHGQRKLVPGAPLRLNVTVRTSLTPSEFTAEYRASYGETGELVYVFVTNHIPEIVE